MRKKSDQADVLGVGATLMSSAPTGQISERLDVGRHRKGQQILAMGVFVMMTFGITVLTVTPAGASTQVNCVTNGKGGACPPGSPIIVAEDTNDQYSVTEAGAVYYGGHQFPGMNGHSLNAPIVGVAGTFITNSGGGTVPAYWLAAADGGIFSFAGAPFFGSMGGLHLDAPIVGFAATNDGRGYWLVAADGGVFAFGDAGFYGSMGGRHLNAPIVGVAPMYDGRGYYLVATDGGLFAFGDAGFYGSMGGRHLNAPIVGIASTGGAGYYLGGRDGGVFTFGDANFWGSAVGLINSPEIAIGATDENIGGLPVPPLWIATIFAASGETVQPQS